MNTWLSFLLFFSLNASAIEKAPEEQADQNAAEQEAPQMSIADFASKFVVKVQSKAANVFTAQPMGGHGTGFIVEITKDKVVIFTNWHVVDTDTYDAQKVTVEFSTDTKLPESVQATIAYHSRLHDFAVLEVNLKDLKRAAKRISPAAIPDPKSPLYKFTENYQKLQGMETFALGNPFDSNNISTFGQITGLYTDPVRGDFVQTQTPINPGNSGGPLLVQETGEVIGMNTMIIAGANSVGWAIPIGVLVDEYLEWRANPDLAKVRQALIYFGFAPAGDLRLMGSDKLITKEIPDFFERFEGTIRVKDAHPSTGLQSGDQIITVNGKPIGMSIYTYQNIVYRSKDQMKLKIIRGKKILDVQVPIRDVNYRILRQQNDFVFLSGLVFGEMSPFEAWATDPSTESPVVIDSVLSTTETNFSGSRFPPENSVVVAITIDEEHVTLKSLLDLKLALRRHPQARSLLLHVKESFPYSDKQGNENVIRTRLGTVVVEPLITYYAIPLVDVVTPAQFQMSRFKKQFSFSQEAFQTRNWRTKIRGGERAPSSAICTQALEGEPAQTQSTENN